MGLALAAQCAGRGMDVALFDRDGARLAQAVEGLTGAHDVRVLSQRVDVASTADLQAAGALVEAAFGRCDLLFSNVGVQHFGAVETVDDDLWRWVRDVNVVGSARTVRASLPLLRRTEGARIAFTSSASALSPAARPLSALDLADPDVAAANMIAGVLADEPHVITHGDLEAAVAEHVRDLQAAWTRSPSASRPTAPPRPRPRPRPHRPPPRSSTWTTSSRSASSRRGTSA